MVGRPCHRSDRRSPLMAARPAVGPSSTVRRLCHNYIGELNGQVSLPLTHVGLIAVGVVRNSRIMVDTRLYVSQDSYRSDIARRACAPEESVAGSKEWRQRATDPKFHLHAL